MENAFAELDLSVLTDNLRLVRGCLGIGSELIFVVKADAYGHGMLPVCRLAASKGVKWFAVAHMDEAMSLTDILPGVQVMILGAVRRDAVKELVARRIVSLILHEEQGLELAAEAASTASVLRCHVKIDTGMGRLGFIWDRAADSIARLSRVRGMEIVGICTHFASSDGPDVTYAQIQVARFHSVIEDCRKLGIAFPMRHVSNSGGFHCLPGCDYEGVRCGIELYGYGPRSVDARIVARPFLQWKSAIAQVRKVPAGFMVGYGSTHTTARETNLATIDVGYADGYSRLLGNKAQVLIGGARVPVVGRVSMNLATVDVGPESAARAGDEVVLLGRQGGEAIWADEIARWCGTIPYEVLTGIRTKARYVVGPDRCLVRAQ